RLDLDHFGAEVGQDHPAARPGLEAGQFENPDAVEGQAHRDARTVTPAASSWSRHGTAESLSPQPRASASTMICSAIDAIGIGTSYSRASAVARPTSLRASLHAKRTVSKSPFITTLGITSDRASPWPNDAPRSASRMASGARPAFTPSVNPS